MLRNINSFLFVLLPLLANAQIPARTCKDLADSVGSGYSTYLNQNRRAAINYYAKCESASGSSKAGIDLTYEGFGIGGDYSASTKSEQCVQAKKLFSVDDLEYARIKQVYKSGLDVVSQCLNLAAKSWDIKTTGYKDAVSINIVNTSANGGTLKGVDIIGGGTPAMTSCTNLPSQYPVTIGASGVSTLCKRTPTQQLVDGTTYTQSEDAFINLQLSDGPISIPLPGYRTSALQSVTESIEFLKKQLSDLQSKILSASNGIKNSGAESYNPGSGYLNAGAAFCPAGSFMVSMRFRVDGGGPHGIVSQVQPICRQTTADQ